MQREELTLFSSDYSSNEIAANPGSAVAAVADGRDDQPVFQRS
jgi:hypothetical protein